MARITKKPGDLFKIPLSNQKVGLAQWLPDGTARIFRTAFSTHEPVPQIDSLPVAFRVLVFKDTPGRYGWEKVKNAPVPESFALPQRYAKKDLLSGELSVYFEGDERPATLDEVRGLETLAVWAHPHIVERLEAQIEGRESAFEKSIRVAI